MKLVLDTNVVIGALNGVPAIRAALNSLDPADKALLGGDIPQLRAVDWSQAGERG